MEYAEKRCVQVVEERKGGVERQTQRRNDATMTVDRVCEDKTVKRHEAVLRKRQGGIDCSAMEISASYPYR